MLTESLKNLSKELADAPAEEWSDPHLQALHDAGKQWATAALDVYVDDHLDAALAISKAIAAFTHLLNPEKSDPG